MRKQYLFREEHQIATNYLRHFFENQRADNVQVNKLFILEFYCVKKKKNHLATHRTIGTHQRII